MINAMRIIGLPFAAFVVAILVMALGQLAFEVLFPVLSDQSMLTIGVSTWFVFLLEAACFFVVGYVVPNWLRSRWALAWLLWPLAALYTLALILQPELYVYFQPQSPVFYVIQGPFFIAGAALIVGYLAKSQLVQAGRHAL
jgi:hypothetical protein